MHAVKDILAKVVRFHQINGTLETKYFKERYGTITEGNTLSGFFGTYWRLIVLLRWSVTCYIMVFVRKTLAA